MQSNTGIYSERHCSVRESYQDAYSQLKMGSLWNCKGYGKHKPITIKQRKGSKGKQRLEKGIVNNAKNSVRKIRSLTERHGRDNRDRKGYCATKMTQEKNGNRKAKDVTYYPKMIKSLMYCPVSRSSLEKSKRTRIHCWCSVVYVHTHTVLTMHCWHTPLTKLRKTSFRAHICLWCLISSYLFIQKQSQVF